LKRHRRSTSWLYEIHIIARLYNYMAIAAGELILYYYSLCFGVQTVDMCIYATNNLKPLTNRVYNIIIYGLYYY